MTSFTCPPEILRQRSAIDCRPVCQGDPSGARVLILITVWGQAGSMPPSRRAIRAVRSMLFLLSRKVNGPATRNGCGVVIDELRNIPTSDWAETRSAERGAQFRRVPADLLDALAVPAPDPALPNEPVHITPGDAAGRI